MIEDLNEKLQFLEFLDKFKYVKRQIFQPESLEEHEDDAQHSWHLSMMVLMFLEDYPELNREKCLVFASMHDLPEIIVGDVGAFDASGRIGKKEREAEAIKEILSKLDSKNRKRFEEWFDEYENLKSKEARFVYQLDKLHPMIMNVLGKGKDWKRNKINGEMVRAKKYQKVDDEFGFREIIEHYDERAKQEGLYFYEKENI